MPADAMVRRLRHWYLTHVHQAAGGDVLVTQELAGQYVDLRRGAETAKRATVDALPLPVG